MKPQLVDVPEGTIGDWKVERFTITAQDVSRQRIRGGRVVPEGTYTRLTHKGRLIMSDTPDEWRDHLPAIGQARGHCLVNGLGLGMVVQAMLEKPNVDKVTVVELSPDVIALVAPHYRQKYGDRFEAIQANALEWSPPPVKFVVVWHDIWEAHCSDNLTEMTALHRKYGRRCEWQGSWGHDECKRLRREGY